MNEVPSSQSDSEQTKSVSPDSTNLEHPAPSGVGIYDRPERKGPSWVAVIAGLLVILLVVALTVFVFQQVL